MSSKLTNRKLLQSMNRHANQNQRTNVAMDLGHLPETHHLMRVLGPRGQHLFACTSLFPIAVDTEKEKNNLQSENQAPEYLCELNARFRNLLWIKRGHVVLVEKFLRQDMKIFGEIVRIVTEKELPSEFIASSFHAECTAVDKEEEDERNRRQEEDENDDDLFQNPNRRRAYSTDSDSDSA